MGSREDEVAAPAAGMGVEHGRENRRTGRLRGDAPLFCPLQRAAANRTAAADCDRHRDRGLVEATHVHALAPELQSHRPALAGAEYALREPAGQWVLEDEALAFLLPRPLGERRAEELARAAAE